jgi:hypothetical protein
MLPNWPWTASVDGFTYPSCRGLSTPPGDVIVLAIDALHPGGRMRSNSITWFQPPTRYNAVGWVSGPFGAHDRERVTLEEARALAALPPTDALAPASASGGLAFPLAVVIAAVVAGLAGIRRLARPEA